MKKLMMIEGMSCMHCVNHVKKALEELDGVTGVAVDLQEKSAVVELSKDLEDKVLKETVEEAGYDVVQIKSI